jgi:hypothetical protein
MPNLTSEQVKGLASDSSSLKSGQELADTRHWINLGRSEAAWWGECKGSAKEPYKVRVDLSNNGSACTCPSRKFPCKHVLALMFLATGSPAKLSESNPPAWVTEWLEKRASLSQAAAKKAAAKSDVKPPRKDASRRAAKREKLAEDGLLALETWLKDLSRQGLAFAQHAPTSFWEDQVARMVDSQLPGAARMIREMAALPGSRPDWAETLLLQLGRVFLLIQAYHKLDTLPMETQQDVRYLLGWNVNQEELLATVPEVSDDWLVLACQNDEDDRTGLRSQASWLLGKTSQRAALVLNFAFRTQALDSSLIPGLTLHGDLCYFPGAAPLRAVFKNKSIVEPAFTPSGSPSLSAFLEDYASVLGKNPWLEAFPVVLGNVTPMQFKQNWFLKDDLDRTVPLSTLFSSPWELFALSGGHPLRLFGTWDGFMLLPLAAWVDKRHVTFCL